MSLSLHQIVAYRELSDRLDRMARSTALVDTVVGSRGDQKTVEKTLKELNRG